MASRMSAESSFWIRCVGYKQNREALFTIGGEYEVKDCRVTNDNGFTYFDSSMKLGNDLKTWYLSGWYQFEIVGERFELSYEDAMGYA